MNRQNEHARQQSARVAFCGLSVALSIVLFLMGSLVPIAAYAVPLLGSLLLLFLLLEFGAAEAWMTFGAVSILGLLLVPDKEAILFYLFLGYYPIVKWRIDRVSPRQLRLPIKLLLFSAGYAAMIGVLTLFFPALAGLSEFYLMGIALFVGFCLLYLLCMILYDRMLNPIALLYVARLQPRLRRRLR